MTAGDTSCRKWQPIYIMSFAIYTRSNTFCAFISHDDQDEGRKEGEGKDASPLSLPRQFHDDDAQQEEEEVEARDAAIKSQLVSKNSARNG